MAAAMDSEVKGILLVTLRRYILEAQGQEALERYVACARERSRADLAAPLPSPWYPEERMHDALEACFAGPCQEDAARFSETMERGATMGTHWFFQILVSVTTPRYLLRLLPTAVRQMRRGPVKLEMKIRDRDARLRFVDHPFADHPLYRLATPAMALGVLRLSAGASARATLVDFDATTQVVEVGWGERPPSRRGRSSSS
jgi:hypothetical protein